MPRLPPSLANIAEAARVIDPVFRNTPQFVSDALSARLGVRTLCKVETLNPIRSFKGRGTSYLLHRLAAELGERLHHTELVCGSAGNFGQGLAYAGRRHGAPVTVFAAETASALKVERMRALGAQVLLSGRDFDAAKDAARDYAAERPDQRRFIEDGREPAITEGAGTIALELGRWPEPVDVALVPLGNGALLAGTGRWLKGNSPATRVVGVCAAGAPAMAESLRAGRPVPTEAVATIADGIAVRVPVPAALDDLRGVVDEVLLVDDAVTLEAMRLVFATLGVVVEPAGAVGLAAALAHQGRFQGALVATPLCGGNATEEQVRRWIG